jgi:hypothetical protein
MPVRAESPIPGAFFVLQAASEKSQHIRSECVTMTWKIVVKCSLCIIHNLQGIVLGMVLNLHRRNVEAVVHLHAICDRLGHLLYLVCGTFVAKRLPRERANRSTISPRLVNERHQTGADSAESYRLQFHTT